ncbi:MAG: DUF488 family protein [Syntrophomonadaceae bacterium]|nr:DUF488 family protein [Syntrophomonadaceae bacterium]
MTEKKGRIITASISSIKNLNCNEIWQITRSGKEIPGAIWVPHLAPSSGLFKQYLNEWKGTNPELWWPQYVERFTEELNRKEALNTLRALWKAIQSGKNIGLVCFCKSPDYCHRTLVGEFMKKYNIEVTEYIDENLISPPLDENYIQYEQPNLF